MAMICYLEAAYATKKKPEELKYTEGGRYYDCFARIDGMKEHENIPRMDRLAKFFLGTAIPFNMEAYPHDEIRSFIHYYRRTHAGRYISAIKKMNDRVIVFAPNMCSSGMAAAFLSPVRVYTEHTNNMRTFIKFCRTGINPNAALLLAHFFTITNIDDDWSKMRTKILEGHDVMSLISHKMSTIHKLKGPRLITPEKYPIKDSRDVVGFPEIEIRRRERAGFSAFWFNGMEKGRIQESILKYYTQVINQHHKSRNPVRPVGLDCIRAVVRDVLNRTGYAIPKCWREAS